MVTTGKPSGQQSSAPIRGWRERAIQTLTYELGGVLIVGPIWKFVAGASATESIVLLICLSVAVMSWMAAYNTLFDVVESRTAGRVASDRPHLWRVVHAVGLEVTSIVVTWPLIGLVAKLDWLDALAADLGLTLAYSVYGYLFYLCFDRLHPVACSPAPKIGVMGVDRPGGE